MWALTNASGKAEALMSRGTAPHEGPGFSPGVMVQAVFGLNHIEL
jgi:hypothetical protein